MIHYHQAKNIQKKLSFEEAKEPEIKFPTSVGSQRKQAENFCFIDYVKIFEFVGHNKLWIILRDGNTRPTYLSPDKPV